MGKREIVVVLIVILVLGIWISREECEGMKTEDGSADSADFRRLGIAAKEHTDINRKIHQTREREN